MTRDIVFLALPFHCEPQSTRSLCCQAGETPVPGHIFIAAARYFDVGHGRRGLQPGLAGRAARLPTLMKMPSAAMAAQFHQAVHHLLFAPLDRTHTDVTGSGSYAGTRRACE
jgi:hypothetical protein